MANVPVRIARGELEGGMPCSRWRELNPDEAARFDRVYALVRSSEVSVDAAIDLEQRGVTVEMLNAQKAEREANERLREARLAVPGTAVDAFRKQLIDDKVDLAVILGDRVLADRLVQVERLSLKFAETGSVAALDVVAFGSRSVWATLRPLARFDEKLLASPAPVHVMPSRRSAADPRPFVEQIGRQLTLTLRNGIILPLKLAAVGPFDLIVGEEAGRILVPLHAISAWSVS